MCPRAGRGILGAVTVLVLLSLKNPCAAQSPTPSSTQDVQEVLVTATRREERLQDVPISVSAFSQESLDQQSLRSIDDLTRLTPGVTFQRNGTGSASNYNDESSDISIRGIDSAAGTSTTGIYIDDTPIQSRHISFGSVNAFPELFDLDRVEILRGPQGTLFGASAEGGALRFISPRTSLTQDSGYLRSELATTQSGAPSYELGAAAGGPLIDDVLGFRISASHRRDGGWVDRVNYTLTPNSADPLLPTPEFNQVTQPNANWQETTTLRAALKWAINDAMNVSPSFYYQELHINDTASYWVGLSNPSADIFYNGNALNNSSTDPFWLAAVKFDWSLGFAQLTANTSLFDRHQHSTSDYTQYLRATYVLFTPLASIYPQPGDAGYAVFTDSQRNIYEEIRLSSTDDRTPLVWTAGLFFSHQNENIPETIHDTTLDAESGGNVCSPALPCPNGEIFFNPINRFIDQQLALFGEATFKFSDTLSATAGLRVSKVDYTGSIYQGGPFLGTPPQSSTASSSEKPVTPKAEVSWRPGYTHLYYVSATKGYRVGGVNVGVGTTCEADLQSLGLPIGPDGVRHVPSQYTSDSLWSYELGGKHAFLDRSLQIDWSVFWINWKNIQQNVYLFSCGSQFTANLGQVVSRGGDIDILYRPLDTLTLDISAAYTDAKFSHSSCAGVLSFDPATSKCAGAVDGTPLTGLPVVSQGDRLPGAPWSFTAAAEQTFRAWAGYKPYLRADFQYTTRQTALLPEQDLHNALNDVTLPGLPVTRNLQLRAGLRWNGYDISLFANNVLDQHPVLFETRDIANNQTDNLYFTRSVRPRTLGLTATYRY